MDLLDIIGKKVLTVRSFRTDRRKKCNLRPEYILFDDKETYIELIEQDYYTYHDCSASARHICVHKDKSVWKKIFDNENDYYPKANTGSCWSVSL